MTKKQLEEKIHDLEGQLASCLDLVNSECRNINPLIAEKTDLKEGIRLLGELGIALKLERDERVVAMKRLTKDKLKLRAEIKGSKSAVEKGDRVWVGATLDLREDVNELKAVFEDWKGTFKRTNNRLTSREATLEKNIKQIAHSVGNLRDTVTSLDDQVQTIGRTTTQRLLKLERTWRALAKSSDLKGMLSKWEKIAEDAHDSYCSLYKKLNQLTRRVQILEAGPLAELRKALGRLGRQRIGSNPLPKKNQ